MSIGSTVRNRLGRFETPAAEAYRAMFISLSDFALKVQRIAPHAERVLEVGCGDGAVADRISNAYPNAQYIGIDVAPDPGRRYSGDPARASFRSITCGQLQKIEPKPFDLILIVDVLHHVSENDDRAQILTDAAAMMAPGGTIMVKEWERSRHLGYLAGATCDRYVSGDRTARFMDRRELSALLTIGAPGLAVVCSTTVRPWACNTLLALRAR